MTTHTQTAPVNTSTAAAIRSALDRFRTLYQPSETLGSRPRVPHPGDVLYWVGCVSAVTALLFFATR